MVSQGAGALDVERVSVLDGLQPGRLEAVEVEACVGLRTVRGAFGRQGAEDLAGGLQQTVLPVAVEVAGGHDVGQTVRKLGDWAGGVGAPERKESQLTFTTPYGMAVAKAGL